MAPGLNFSSPQLRLYAGATLISLSPVWVELSSVAPTTSAFYRVFFGAVALFAYLVLRRRRFDLPRTVWLLLALAAVFFSLDLWFWHRSIELIGPGLSTLLANFQVFVLTLAGILFYRQYPAKTQWLAMPLALVGLAMIVGLDWQALSPGYRAGVVLGLLTALSYGSYLVTMRALRDKADRSLPVREIAIVSAFSAVLLAGSAAVEGQSLALHSWSDAGWMLAYGLLSHSLGMILIVSSLPQVASAEAGIALLLQPTLSFIWDVVLFARPTTALEYAGAALALFAIWLGGRRRSNDPER